MTIALFAGRFDPVTNGHLDTALRASGLFDEVVVGVAEQKTSLFTTEERVEMFRKALDGVNNVKVEHYGGLTVNFARSLGATVLIRSMRGNTDFEAEFSQALMNRQMASEIESVYLIARLEHLFISGSRIREVASLGYDVTGLVPAHVAEALKRKFGEA